MGFTRGKEWLEQAISSLKQGNVPPPNPNDRRTLRFLFEFKSSEDNRTFLVELIDYSGELIDPDLSESDLARRLRQHMLTMDGLLILAEAPHREQRLTELYQELQRLTRAFAILRAEKDDGPVFQIPVALLVNKWDRLSSLQHFSAEGGRKEVEAFLNGEPQPPHSSLVDNVRGSVADGNFQFFAVSAFGRHIKAEAHAGEGGPEPDRPSQVNPLCSFGLEDGFVWTCRRRDTLEVEELEGGAAGRAWWKVWQLLGLRTGGALLPRAVELSHRFPPGSPERHRVDHARGGVIRALAGQALLVLAVVLLGWIGVEAAIDDRVHRSALTTLANPQADLPDLERSERWLEEYSRAWPTRHLGYRGLALVGGGLSRGGAKDELTRTRARQVARYWEIIREKAPDRIAQLGPAEAMLRKFPNCEQAAELQQIIEDGKRKAHEERVQFEAGYHELMRKVALRAAAQRLVEQRPEAEGLDALKGDFRAKAVQLITDSTNALAQDRQWARARDELNAVRRDRYVKSLLSEEDLRRMEDLAHSVSAREDRHLYALVENPQTRTLEVIQRYLVEAPLKTMRKQVEDWRDHLRLMAGQIEFELEGTAIWGGNCWDDYKNAVTITLDGTEVFEAEATSKPGERSDLGTKKLKRRLSDRLNVNVQAKVTSGTFLLSSREHGQGTFEGRVGDLRGGGKTVELDKFGNKIVLKIRSDSLPKEPALPEWRE